MGRWVSMLSVVCLAVGCTKPAETSSIPKVAVPTQAFAIKKVYVSDKRGPDSDLREVPAEEILSQMPSSVFSAIKAINSEDWEAVRKFAGSTERANGFITKCEQDPVRIKDLSGVAYGYEFEGQLCACYSFSMEYPGGQRHPHVFEVIVSENKMPAEILDFWEYGW